MKDFVAYINSNGRCYIMREAGQYHVIFAPQETGGVRLTVTCPDLEAAYALRDAYLHPDGTQN